MSGGPREVSRAALGRLSSLGFQFLHVIGGYAVDRDPARFHGFRDYPDQLDLEQAISNTGALDLDVIRKAELAA
jgi:hypothetical protein